MMNISMAVYCYNAFNVYCRELAPGTVSLTGDRAQDIALSIVKFSVHNYRVVGQIKSHRHGKQRNGQLEPKSMNNIYIYV